MLYYAQVSRVFYLSFESSHHGRSQLLDGANNARSDDISRVKSEIVTILNTRIHNPIEPALKPNTRDDQGLQNDFTGRLLCPIKYNWDDPM